MCKYLICVHRAVMDDPAVLHYINFSPTAILDKYSLLGRFLVSDYFIFFH